MLNQRYGPNWKLVSEYISGIEKGFIFSALGKVCPQDHQVDRVYDWNTARKVLYYDHVNGNPMNSRYLKFLSIVHQYHEDVSAIAEREGLLKELKQAGEDASEQFLSADDFSDEFCDFYLKEEEDETYPYYTYSIQDHCLYIAEAFVVSHKLINNLLQDMWFWYQAGHWPCGWEGEWPNGKLIVF